MHTVAEAESRAWEGGESLEWELPSPPPHHLGNATGDQSEEPAMTTATHWTEAELARRRATSRRLAWVIGAVALFIYGAAFWFR